MASWRNREYRVWRAKVIRRDKRCVVCNSIQDRQAHHMNSGSYFPEERYDIENGVTLCKACHTKYHCDYHKSFREKCKKIDFKNFISLATYLIGINKKQ